GRQKATRQRHKSKVESKLGDKSFQMGMTSLQDYRLTNIKANSNMHRYWGRRHAYEYLTRSQRSTHLL
ncbi:MAG: hypothetical protein ACN6NT_02040, partial [Comamonas sp.]